MALPSTYKEIEYIQSSGTQYIDTGYIPSNNTKIEMSMGGWNQTGTYNDLFGARESWGSSGKGFLLGHNGTNGDYYSMFGANKSGTSMPGFSFIDGDTHNIVMSQDGIYQDGTQKVTFSTITFTSPVNLLLFALNDNGTKGEYGCFKLYYCKIWNSGTLIRDFVPCYRKSDSVIGLYDLVNNVFYTNAGTGTFTKGPNVRPAREHEMLNAYIGEYKAWEPGENTLAYYPFISDLKDYSGNGYDFTTYSGTTTFVNNMVQATGLLRRGSLMSQLGNNFTLSMYFLHAGSSCSLQDSDDLQYPTLMFGGGGSSILLNLRYNNNRYTTSYTLTPDNKIHHIVVTKEGTTIKLYVDGELKNSSNFTYTIVTNKTYFHLGNINNQITKKFGNLILEKTVRTAEEVYNYYNNTKSQYGL